LSEASDGSELSLVVVAPRYRGAGVSRLLIRTAIATAMDLGKKFVMLECIPTHADMYGKYGFVSLVGHHCRSQDLDQIAIGMRLGLEDSPFNRAVSLARRDTAMLRLGRLDSKVLFGSKALCLCSNGPCWKEGEYGTRGRPNCPLKESHASSPPLSRKPKPASKQ
jgi:hypothetical protein